MKVLIIGGAGYVGSVLAPWLKTLGHDVTVYDTFWFGNTLSTLNGIELIIGDLRDSDKLNKAIEGQDAIIHLACISNDPSFDLDPYLGRSINYDPFKDLLDSMKRAGTKKFIYASSSSVYGVSKEIKVTEETACNPLTDYSKYKLACEELLKLHGIGDGEWTIVRPATVCGMSPRLRLDVIVNAMTLDALSEKCIHIHGGLQYRPNITMSDMCYIYSLLLEKSMHKQVFNAGHNNLTINEIAMEVQSCVSKSKWHPVKMQVSSGTDNRSYRINSLKFMSYFPDFKFNPISTAIAELIRNFDEEKIPYPNSSFYRNIHRIKELNLI